MKKIIFFALVCSSIFLALPARTAFASDEGIYIQVNPSEELSTAYVIVRQDDGIYLEAPSLKDAVEAEEFDTHTLEQGENLWEVASLRTVYGDPEMYPLLVDANPEYFTAPKVGMKIRVPRDITHEMVAKAHELAWTPAYAGRIGLKFTREQYVQFRLQIDHDYWTAKSMANKVAMR